MSLRKVYMSTLLCYSLYGKCFRQFQDYGKNQAHTTASFYRSYPMKILQNNEQTQSWEVKLCYTY